MHKLLALVLACTVAYAVSDMVRAYLPNAATIVLLLILTFAIYKVVARYLEALRD